jgi:hypothetical protein
MVVRVKRKTLLSLYEAAWAFAPAAMRNEASRRRSEPRPRLPRGKYGEHGDAIISALTDLQDGLDSLVDPREPTPAMKAWLRQKLTDGKFEAYGVKIRPELVAEPTRIPFYFFKGRPNINWRVSSIENLGHRFEIVEVARQERNAILGVGEPAKPSVEGAGSRASSYPTEIKILPGQRGRTTKADEIRHAIKGLMATGVDLAELPRAVAYEKIRIYAKAHLGANVTRGYSVPVLQRCLVRLLGKRI